MKDQQKRKKELEEVTHQVLVVNAEEDIKGKSPDLDFQEKEVSKVAKIHYISESQKKRGFTNIFKKKFHVINIENVSLSKENTELTIDYIKNNTSKLNKNLPVKLIGDLPKEFKIKKVETNLISIALKEKLEKAKCEVIIIDL